MTNSKFNAVYLEKIDNFISAFKDRFIDFQKVKMLLDLFCNPFAILPENSQLELIDLQNDENQRNKLDEDNLLNFYLALIETIIDNALKMTSLFGSTYICEQTFSILNINKSKTRNRLPNESLESILKFGTTKFQPNIKEILKSMQCHL